MFDFSSSLFWYKLVFMAELVVSELIFSQNLHRRDSFYLRAGLSAAGLFIIAFLFPIITYSSAWTVFLFFALFFASLCAMKFCYNESWWNIVFCGLAAYAIQHISFIVFSIANDLIGIVFRLSSIKPYADSIKIDLLSMLYAAGLYILSYLSIYMTAYSVYPHKIRSDGVIKIGRAKFIVLAGLILLAANIFNAITLYSVSVGSVPYWTEQGYNLFSCFLAIQLQFSQLSEKETQSELTAVHHILREEQKQFEIVKQNMDVINIKCHDMKHQIRAIRARGAAGLADADKELDDIEKVIDIHDAVINTGNEALDIIITEKNLVNVKSGIHITCIADGAQLDFMRPTDLYSLFGNALDNAIEAVKSLSESKRNINLAVKTVGNMVSIRIENYFDGNVMESKGILLTTKPDKINHGYGMLSIRTVTEKYRGTMAFDYAGEIFNLNILFPHPEK